MVPSWTVTVLLQSMMAPSQYAEIIFQRYLWNLNGLFLESVSHLALKLLSLMDEMVGLFP